MTPVWNSTCRLRIYKLLFLVYLFHDVDKICRRQLKEGHQADVPVGAVDSVCSKINQIGQHSNQVSSVNVFSAADTVTSLAGQN